MRDKVLVIEGNPAVAKRIEWRLQRKYNVIIVPDSKAGLEVACKEFPDLIILDAEFLSGDDPNLCRQIRNNGLQSPILALTLNNTLSERVVVFQAGVDDFISKPINFDELVTRLDMLHQQGPLIGSEVSHDNPYTAGAPVIPDKFYGREQTVRTVLAAIKAKNHPAIYGERRIGKTSLLHRLEYLLKREETDVIFVPLFVQMQKLAQEESFFGFLMDVLLKSIPTLVKESLPSLARQTTASPYDVLDLSDDLEMVIKTWNDKTQKQIQLVFLIDEGDYLNKFSKETQERLRGLLQDPFINQHVRLVWSGVEIDHAWKSATSPWYNILKPDVPLDRLETEEALRLISGPVAGVYRYDDTAITKILELTQHKPYLIQLLCQKCIDYVQKHGVRRGRIILEDVEAVQSDFEKEVTPFPPKPAPVSSPFPPPPPRTTIAGGGIFMRPPIPLPSPSSRPPIPIEEQKDETAEPLEERNPVLPSPPQVDPVLVLTPEKAYQIVEEVIGSGRRIDAIRQWPLPPVDQIFEEGFEPEFNEAEMRQWVEIIEEALAGFSVKVTVREIRWSSRVTQFGLELGDKATVSQIKRLKDDLALALSATSIRIEPIPGRSYLGLEVPNSTPYLVVLRTLIESAGFFQTPGPLKLALGQYVGSYPIIVDLTSMPHLFIAGATGSGKSVCLDTLIACLLSIHTPVTLRLLMIDPKMGDLSNYNDIPHLLAPVLTDLDRSVGALSWAIHEMERRYLLFAKAGVRNIISYNQKILNTHDKILPYIVILIDGLNDLLMSSIEMEQIIAHLAQKSPYSGIHLIVATQSPLMKPVMRLIRANYFPARIAFAVKTPNDSRMILNSPDAELLLGKGDMLYKAAGNSILQRLQGGLVSGQELSRLINFLRNSTEKYKVARETAIKN